MDRVFLDANVLFSAAYEELSGLSRLWPLTNTERLTSTYAVEEARRNLHTAQQRDRLDRLLEGLTIVAEAPRERALPPGVTMPRKDHPILLAAIEAKATHLLTGDQAHFGAHYGRKLAGVLVLRPAAYLRDRPR